MRLDRDRVVRTALALLDETGLEGLALRRIARQLDVQAPALYWHFRNKQELLDEMATTMLRDLLAEDPGFAQDLPWAGWMAASMQALRRMLLRYRDGAKVFSGTYLTDDALLEAQEVPLRKLTSTGFSLPQAARAWSTLYLYTIGFVIEEQAVHPRPGERDERYDPAKRARRIDASKFPLTLAAGQETFADYDKSFEEGLRLILSGIEQGLLRGRER
jgi:AcrR family transcriptional regulator